MRVSVVITAAGRGRRFRSAKNKTLVRLGKRPVLAWSLDVFSRLSEVQELIVVCHRRDEAQVRKLVRGYAKVSQVVLGGEERFDSAWRGLQSTSTKSQIVLVHDAARPLIEANTIRETIQTAAQCGGAVVAVPAVDTQKRSKDGKTILKTVPREGLWRAQTPQGFRRDQFLAAYRRAITKKLRFSDDAGVAEYAGMKVALVQGSERNLKITHPEDLALAEFYCRRKSSR